MQPIYDWSCCKWTTSSQIPWRTYGWNLPWQSSSADSSEDEAGSLLIRISITLPRLSKPVNIQTILAVFWHYVILLREAAKKITVFFLVARPLRGGEGKGLAIKKKNPLFFSGFPKEKCWGNFTNLLEGSPLKAKPQQKEGEIENKEETINLPKKCRCNRNPGRIYTPAFYPV